MVLLTAESGPGVHLGRSLLRGHRNRSRSAKRLRKTRQHREVGVELNLGQTTNAERRESIVVLQATELARGRSARAKRPPSCPATPSATRGGATRTSPKSSVETSATARSPAWRIHTPTRTWPLRFLMIPRATALARSQLKKASQSRTCSSLKGGSSLAARARNAAPRATVAQSQYPKQQTVTTRPRTSLMRLVSACQIPCWIPAIREAPSSSEVAA